MSQDNHAYRHCGRVFAYEENNHIFIKCRKCGKWVDVGSKDKIIRKSIIDICCEKGIITT